MYHTAYLDDLSKGTKIVLIDMSIGTYIVPFDMSKGAKLVSITHMIYRI